MTPGSHCPSCDHPLDPTKDTCPNCGHTRGTEAPGTPKDPPAEGQRASEDKRLAGLLRDALAPNLLLVRELGHGGMGTVYLAREPALKRMVAVKVLAPELAQDPKARRRFEREAQSAAAIAHPNVVAVHGVGELADETPYFVMGYVGGPSLEQRLEREGVLEVEEAKRVIGQVASALEAAHRLGIIHRDIKPGNILYDEKAGHVLVSDFGISSVLKPEDGDEHTALTETGMLVGTPAYMSPEQLAADEVTEQSDIYSLGLVAYRLLSGRGPFDVKSSRELIAAILRDPPRKLSDLRPDVDPELEALIEACLARDPGERPRAGQIARRLAVGAGALLEWPPPALEQLQGKAWRVAGLTAVGSILLASHVLALLTGLRLRTNWTLGFISVLGFIVTLGAIAWVLWLGWRILTAVRLGYGWLTIAEVLADRRRDTGPLISGTREYARLPAPVRSRLRALRVVRAALVLLAAVWPPLGLALGAFLGGRNLVGASWIWTLVIVVTVLALVAALLSANYELRHVERARREIRRRRSQGESSIRLAEPWNASFEAARPGQALGAGGLRPLSVALLTAALVIVVFVGATVVLPLSLVSQFARVNWGSDLPRFGNTEQKVELARAVSAYRLPPDPAISPIEAGRALYTLYATDRDVPSYAKRPTRSLEPDWLDAWYSPDNPFATGVPPQPRLLTQAAAGLSPEQVAVLRRTADHPGFAEFAIAARAREADVLSASFELPLPDTVTYWMLPVPRYSLIKDAAHAHIAKAALELAEGRPSDAETTLRSVISVGMLMADEGTNLIETLVGTVIAGIGRQGLVELFRVTGREAEAQRIVAAVDSVQAAYEIKLTPSSIAQAAADPLSVLEESDDVQLLRERLAAIATDSTRLRSLRWELVPHLAFAACTNPLEIVLGPDGEHRRMMAAAREQLVRRPSDAALFQIMAEALERPLPLQRSGPAQVVITIAAAVVGERLRSCAFVAGW